MRSIQHPPDESLSPTDTSTHAGLLPSMRRVATTLLLFAAMVRGADEPPAGFTSLFNGRDLTGWRGGATYDPRKLMELPAVERATLIEQWTKSLTEISAKTGQPHWRAEGGELINDGFGGYATTERDYGDFELLIDYKTVPLADSGIYLRGIPQVQIWDRNHPDPRGIGYAKGSGGLYNNLPGSPGKDPLVVADRPFGEWNRFRILMVADRVTVWLNDKLVVDHAVLENHFDKKLPPEQRRPIPQRGPIQLQTHGGEIRWRNLFIREIGPAEAARVLDRHAPVSKAVVPSAPIQLFNGRDLSNFYTWLRGHRYADPDRVFTVVQHIDGGPAIRASGQHFGGLITKERYANYRLLLEFRWGTLTWEPRKTRARDAGILFHCQGPDGNSAAELNSPWQRSVEFQIIEGGTGDMLLVGGVDRPGAERVSPSMTVPVRAVANPARPGSVTHYWDPQGAPKRLTGGRVNWFGRDPGWTGDLGFRGPRDVEKPVGEWNRLDLICDGDSVEYFVNGTKVNSGAGSSLREGRILFQSEGAEIYYRGIELHPLKK